MIRRPLTTISLKQSDVEQMTDFLKPKVKIVSIEGTVSQKVITAKNLLSKASPTLKNNTPNKLMLKREE
uniref:Uncharacterized protein n=1 Tax=Ditylenchus dipsaci TaxID=166011 RepID=A0A915E2H7_9BILA